MGNKQSKSYKPSPFNKQNWHLINNSKQKRHLGDGLYNIFRNNLTNEQIEQYHIFFHNQAELQKYLQFFEWRERQDNIVNAKFINLEQTKQFCNTNHAAKVYLEHISVRLSDIQDIPFPQNLYVLFSTLQGFQKLYQTVGFFKINQELICMDRDGRVKVWLNSDLSKCHTQGSNFSDQVANFHQSQRLEEQMVNEIITMIEANTAKDADASMTVTQFLKINYKGKGLNFRTAKQQLLAYAKRQETDIPNYFQSVIGIFDEEEHITDNENASNIQENRRPPTHTDYQESHNVESQLRNSDERKYYGHQNNYIRNGGNSVQNGNKQTGNYKTLERIPSNERFGYSDQFRPNTHVPSPTYIQNASIISLPQQRAQSPIQQLQPIQPSLITNNSNIKVRFNYNPNATTIGQTHTIPLRIPQFISSTSYPVAVHSSTQQTITSNISTYNPPIVKTVAANSQQAEHEMRLIRSSSLKHVICNNKLLYSDSSQTYELDPQITQDMFKYLNI